MLVTVVIMANQLDLKDSSRNLQPNCAINFFPIFNAICMCPKIQCDG